MKRETADKNAETGQQMKKFSGWLSRRESLFTGTQRQERKRTSQPPQEAPAELRDPSVARERISAGLRLRLGTDSRTGDPICWQPAGPGQMNACVLGMPGAERTQLTKSLVLQIHRCRLRDPMCPAPEGILILDCHGNYNETKPEFPDAVRAKVLKHSDLVLNPFSLAGLVRKPQLPVHTAMNFADAMAFTYGLDPIQKSTLVQAVMAAYARRGITSDPATWNKSSPTFEDVREEYGARPTAQHNDSLDSMLDTLSAYQMFHGENRAGNILRGLLEGVVVLDLSGCPENLRNLVTAMILQRLRDRMSSGPVLNRLVLLDEADTAVERDFQPVRDIIREGARSGVSLLLGLHQADKICTWEEALRSRIDLWSIRSTEDLKRNELELLFGGDSQDVRTEQLIQNLRRTGLRQSLLQLNGGEPVFAEELSFSDVLEDRAEGYLREKITKNITGTGGGMPVLDARNLDVFELSDEEAALPENLLDLLK